MIQAVNAATFGKSVKHAFIGIKTRRLGNRGSSKYHCRSTLEFKAQVDRRNDELAELHICENLRLCSGPYSSDCGVKAANEEESYRLDALCEAASTENTTTPGVYVVKADLSLLIADQEIDMPPEAPGDEARDGSHEDEADEHEPAESSHAG